MTLAKGRLDLHIKPAKVRFDDHQWHKIIVHRRVQEVTIVIILSIHPRINEALNTDRSKIEFNLEVNHHKR